MMYRDQASYAAEQISELTKILTLLRTFSLVSEPGERDLVIMKHRIGVEWPNNVTSTEEISMTVYGDAYGHSAMAKMVGYPAAIAAKMIMDGE